MIKEEDILAKFDKAVSLPIKYVVHRTETDNFKISIFYETYLKGHRYERNVNSDVPVATWYPKRGISGLNYTHILLRDAGLEPTLEKFCEQAYKAWRKKRKERRKNT